MKKIIAYSFVALFFLSFLGYAANSGVTSEFSTPSYEVNKSVQISISCDYNTSLCTSPEVLCNLTILYPDYSVMVENASMDFITNGIYNYTVQENITNTIGNYYGVTRCYKTSVADFTGFADVSFRVVDELLYHGGGISMYEIAIIIGLVLAALGMTIAGVFAKTIWMRILMTFSGLTTLIIQGDVMMKIAAADSAIGIQTVLVGFYFLSIFVSITALALLFVNILWDYTNLFIGIEKWSQKFVKKKPETLEE